MKATPIPTASRTAVQERSQGRCERCGGRGAHWHHRRSRSVRDGLTHSPANGVLLCTFDHAWVHAHPKEAREEGFIVRREADPRWVRIKRWDGHECYLDEAGRYLTVLDTA